MINDAEGPERETHVISYLRYNDSLKLEYTEEGGHDILVLIKKYT